MTEIYVSTDVEADGPIPGPHSMLSFASAAFRPDKTCVATSHKAQPGDLVAHFEHAWPGDLTVCAGTFAGDLMDPAARQRSRARFPRLAIRCKLIEPTETVIKIEVPRNSASSSAARAPQAVPWAADPTAQPMPLLRLRNLSVTLVQLSPWPGA